MQRAQVEDLLAGNARTQAALGEAERRLGEAQAVADEAVGKVGLCFVGLSLEGGGSDGR